MSSYKNLHVKQLITNKKFLACGISILVGIIILSAFIFLKEKMIISDLSDIGSHIDSYSVEYKSERGFGNDRFDIYSFKLKKSNEIGLFKLIDSSFQNEYTYFESMVENIKINKGNSDTNIMEKLKKFMLNKNTKYYSIHVEGTKKLYLYNEKINKGYCLILTI